MVLSVGRHTSIDASFIINFNMTTCWLNTANWGSNIPFTGPNINGWYLISVPDLSANALGITSYGSGVITDIFRRLNGLSDYNMGILEHAFIDHTNLKKLSQPNIPLPNNGIINSNRWTPVVDPSGHNFTSTLIPALDRQQLYGYLGYFVYLIYIIFGWTNKIWILSLLEIDISGTLSTSSTLSVANAFTIVVDTAITTSQFNNVNASEYLVPSEMITIANYHNFGSMFKKTKLPAYLTKLDNKIILPMAAFTPWVNVKITDNYSLGWLNTRSPPDFTNAFFDTPDGETVSYSDFLTEHYFSTLQTVPAVVVDPANSSHFSLRWVLPQIPNSSIQFRIMAFSAHTDSDTIIGMEGYVTGTQKQADNFTNYIGSSFTNETANILLLDGYEVKTVLDGGQISELNIPISGLEQYLKTDAQLYPQDGYGTPKNNTIPASDIKSLTLYIEPQIWLNGGDNNSTQGGVTLYFSNYNSTTKLATLSGSVTATSANINIPASGNIPTSRTHTFDSNTATRLTTWPSQGLLSDSTAIISRHKIVSELINKNFGFSLLQKNLYFPNTINLSDNGNYKLNFGI